MSQLLKTPDLGTGVAEDRDRVSFPELRRARRDRVLAAMEQQNLDVCVFGREGNVRYVSGARRLWTAQSRAFVPSCVVVRETGRVHLMTFSSSYEGIPEEVPPEDFYVLTWNPGIFMEKVGAVPGAAAAKRVGVDGMSPFFQGLLPLAFPGAELVGAEPMIRAVRRSKLPDEIVCLRTAAAVAESALVAAAGEVRPGVTEKHLQAVFLERMTLVGTSQFSQQGTFTTVGPDGGLRLFTDDRTLDEGTMVALSGGTLWAGYEGSLARTWFCGRSSRPTADQRALHGRWRSVVDRVIDACRPGATGADLRAVHEAVEPLPRWAVVHSVGMGHEGPIAGSSLGPDVDRRQVLEAGMVLGVRTFVGGATGGYLGEDMVLVGDDGPERLTTLGDGPLSF